MTPSTPPNGNGRESIAWHGFVVRTRDLFSLALLAAGLVGGYLLYNATTQRIQGLERRLDSVQAQQTIILTQLQAQAQGLLTAVHEQRAFVLAQVHESRDALTTQTETLRKLLLVHDNNMRKPAEEHAPLEIGPGR